MNPDLTPLEFFKYLVFENGVEDEMSKFLINNKLKEDGYTYLSTYDYYIKETLVEDGENSYFLEDIIDRNIFFYNILQENRNLLFRYLSLELSKDSSNENEILKRVYDDLFIVYNKSVTFEENKYGVISEFFKKTVSDLRILYPKNVSHSVFKILNNFANDSLSFFQVKDAVTVPKIKLLYEIAYELSLIDDLIVSEDSFIDVFTSSKTGINSKIFFQKSNPMIAAFLKKIEPFFYNFNSKTIEQAKCFYNKQGKLINSSDLYVALSRGKINDKTFLKFLNERIDDLKLELKLQ